MVWLKFHLFFSERDGLLKQQQQQQQNSSKKRNKKKKLSEINTVFRDM